MGIYYFKYPGIHDIGRANIVAGIRRSVCLTCLRLGGHFGAVHAVAYMQSSGCLTHPSGSVGCFAKGITIIRFLEIYV